MPNPGTVNNPGGVNGLYDTAEEPYGAVKRLQQQTRAAPLAGQATTGTATAAPKRAKRAGTRPAAAPGEQASPPPGELPQPPAPVSPAEVWQQIAQSPGAADYPILQQIAEQARG